MDIGIRCREIVFLLPLLGDLHFIDNNINPAGIHTGKQGVPFGFYKLGSHSQLFCNLLRYLNVKPYQFATLVVVAVGGIGSLCPDSNDTLFLNLCQ